MSSDSFELVREDASNHCDDYDVKESSTAMHEADAPSPASSLASSILSSPGEDLNDPLRQALTQAQTRARLSDEKIHWLMEHVDRCIKATMKEVHQAKYEVRRLRKIVNDEEEKAAADESTINLRHHPFQRSVSDTPPQFSQRGTLFNPSLFLSPLSSALPSVALSSASSSSRLTAPPLNLDSILDASSTPNETGTTNSDEHSSSSSTSPPPSIPGNNSVANGSVMEESYCMLPMGESMSLTGGGELSSSSASSSTHALNIGIPHSASLKAMIEAGEAYHELSRDSTPIVQDESKSLTGFPASPIVSNSLTSASNIDLAAAPSPISQSARSQSNTQLGGLASGSGAPRPISLNRGVSIGGTSSSPGLAGLRSRPPHQSLARQHQLTHSQSVQSLRNMKPLQQNNLNEALSSSGVTLASVLPASSLSSINSTPALGPLSSSSSSSISPARRDLASAVRAFKEAQIRFDALTHLCAPIVFQSQRYVRLKERASFQQFGVINSDDEDESHRRRNHITDEELSDSTTPNDEANPENNTTLAERMEMEIYLKKIRTEIAEEEEKGDQSTIMNKQDGTTSASAPSPTDVLDQPSIFGSSLTMVDHPQSFSLEEAYQSCVLLYQQLKAREEEIKRIKDEKQEGENKHQQEIESSRARCSALEQRDRNIALILEQLKIPIDEKGNPPDGYQLQTGSSFWHKSLTAVAFGSLLFASCISWKHIFSHISDGSDRIIKVCVSIGISEEWIRKLLTTLHLHSATAASTASASASSAAFSSASAASSEAAATAAAAAASAAATAAINRATTATSTSIPSNAAASIIGHGSRGREYVHLPFSSSSSYTGHFSSPPPAPLPSSFHSADFVEDTSFHVFPRLFDFIARFSIQYMTAVVQ